jgi:hypothetical protein
MKDLLPLVADAGWDKNLFFFCFFAARNHCCSFVSSS